MLGNLIAVAAFALVVYAMHLKEAGLDRVLIKAKERPARLKGSKVLALIPSRKPQPGWISPPGIVSGYEGGLYVVDFGEPWSTEYGNLPSIRVRSGMDGNPLSKLAASRAQTRGMWMPIVALLPDGREIPLELGVGGEPDDA